ncbi:MAG: efflux RND transporter periplasmic adaptor subunit [Desulfomonile sp.]|nr:efflux RND transporter periplasmic adaptor subunit [Desulfomonile sp.]
MPGLRTEKRVRHVKAYGIALACLIAVGSIVLTTLTHEPKPAVSGPVPARAAIVPQLADAKSEAEVLFRGKAFAEFKRDVTMRFPAEINEILVTEGQKVKQGQVLASYTLDRSAMMQVHNTLFPETVLRFQQTLYEQELALERLTGVSLDLKKLRLQRLQKELVDLEQLQNKNMVHLDAIKNKQREVEAIQKEMEEIENTIKQTTGAIEKTRENLRHYEERQKRAIDLLEWQNSRSYSDSSIPLDKGFLKSPVDGQVVWISPMLRVKAEVPSGFHAITVAPMDEVVVRCKVHELDLVKLKPGDRGSVTFDAFPEKPYECKVSRIPWVSRNTALEAPADYEIECVLENPDAGLKEGLTCNVKVTIKD